MKGTLRMICLALLCVSVSGCLPTVRMQPVLGGDPRQPETLPTDSTLARAAGDARDRASSQEAETSEEPTAPEPQRQTPQQAPEPSPQEMASAPAKAPRQPATPPQPAAQPTAAPAPATLVSTGHMLVEKGNLGEARLAFRQATELAPGNCDAWVGFAETSERMGELEVAFSGWGRAAECTGGNTGHLARQDAVAKLLAEDALRQGHAAMAAKRYPEAEVLCLQGLDYQRNNPALWNLWGDALKAQGKTNEAAKKYEEAIARAPQQPPAEKPVVEERAQQLPPADTAPEPTAAPGAVASSTGNLTRADLALLAHELLPWRGLAPSRRPVVVTDISRHPARDEIDMLLQRQVFESLPGHRFLPDKVVSRRDLAVFLRHYLERQPGFSVEHLLAGEPVLPDVPRYHQDWEAIAAAVALGAIPLDAKGQFSPGDPVGTALARNALSTVR